MEYLKPRRRFVHASFRIPLDLKEKLETEAEAKNDNLNALVNQVLAKHVTFDLMAEHTGTIVLEKLLFSEIIDRVTTDELEAIGKELGPKVVNQWYGFLNIRNDFDSLIRHYFRPMSAYSGWYRFNSVGSGSSQRMMFEHEYGPAWSAFLKQYVAGTIKSIMEVEPKVTTKEGLVILHF